MGHPYNQLQQVAHLGLSDARYIGTDVQKTFFYGIDRPTLRWGFTGHCDLIYFDYPLQNFELITSGDFIPLVFDRFILNAVHTGEVRGESVDYPLLSIVPTGVEVPMDWDEPAIAWYHSGNYEPSMREPAYYRWTIPAVEQKKIDWDKYRKDKSLRLAFRDRWTCEYIPTA